MFSAAHRFIIADDHPLFRGALRQAVEKFFKNVQIFEVGTLEDVCHTLDLEEDIDLIFLDLSMPGMRGFSGLMFLRAQYTGVPIVVVSGNEDPAVVRSAMEFGASGYIPKSLGVNFIEEAVNSILEGGIWVPSHIDLTSDSNEAKMAQRMASLTPQQVRVLMMLSQGLLNKQIAYELSVSEATVKAHVSAILQKLAVESRTQAVIAAARLEAGQLAELVTG